MCNCTPVTVLKLLLQCSILYLTSLTSDVPLYEYIIANEAKHRRLGKNVLNLGGGTREISWFTFIHGGGSKQNFGEILCGGSEEKRRNARTSMLKSNNGSDLQGRSYNFSICRYFWLTNNRHVGRTITDQSLVMTQRTKFYPRASHSDKILTFFRSWLVINL